LRLLGFLQTPFYLGWQLLGFFVGCAELGECFLDYNLRRRCYLAPSCAILFIDGLLESDGVDVPEIIAHEDDCDVNFLVFRVFEVLFGEQ